MLLSGFFSAADNYVPYLIPFEYISAFKYAFQILITIEFRDIQPLNCMNSVVNPCDPLNVNYTFKEELWLSCLCLALLIIFFKILSFIITKFRSKMKA